MSTPSATGLNSNEQNLYDKIYDDENNNKTYDLLRKVKYNNKKKKQGENENLQKRNHFAASWGQRTCRNHMANCDKFFFKSMYPLR